MDVHVATALLHQCLLHPDLLGHAARVVVSHQLWWLNSASRVIMMDVSATSLAGHRMQRARNPLHVQCPDPAGQKTFGHGRV